MPSQSLSWPSIDGHLIGGVSSFGFSGTNVHVVLEAAETKAERHVGPSDGWLVPLSAHRQDALLSLAAATRDAIAPDASLADVARTLTLGRASLAHRAVVRADSVADLRTGLDAIARGDEAPGVRSAQLTGGDPPRIAFLFTGQGAQYAGMAARLYNVAPAFREAFDRCDQILVPLLGRSLRASVLEATDATALEQTDLAQPALFAVEYALAEFLRGLGIVPMAVMGHSVGEYVAACVAGAIDLPDALSLIAARGALMQSLPVGGAMAAVFASESTVAEALAPFAADVSIAAVNGPAQTVISGTAASVQAVCDVLAARGTKTHRLPVSHAFHSPLVAPILDAFEAEAKKVSFRAPRIRIISNLTGKPVVASEIQSSSYWRRHLREGVRFADGLTALAALDVDLCVEIGPHPALSAFAATVFDQDASPRFITTLRRGADDWQSILDAVGQLHLAGAEINWRGLDPDNVGRPITLPTAHFHRRRYWFSANTPVPAASGKSTGHPLLGVRLNSPLATETVQFEAILSSTSVPFIADHVVQQRVIMPAAAMIDMALRAGRIAGDATCDIENFLILHPLALDVDAPRIVQTVVRRAAGRVTSFEIASCDTEGAASDWMTHAQGDYAPALEVSAATGPDTTKLDQAISAEDHYRSLERRGLTFGPSLHGVRSVRRRDGVAVGEIVTPNAAGEGDFSIHPAQLDACLQIIAPALANDDNSTFLPVGIDRIRLARLPGQSVQAHVAVRGRQLSLIRADVVILDAIGEVGRLEGVSLRPARAAASSDLYNVEWRPVAVSDDRADWMPYPGELKKAFEGRIVALAQEHELDAYQQSFLDLERRSSWWIVRALEALGWRPVPGERVPTNKLAERLAVAPRYHRLLPRLLDILVEDGILRSDAGDFSVVNWPVHAASQDEQAIVHSDQARTAIAAACGNDLAGILAGRIDPLHRLFPGGSSGMAERLYRESPESKAYNNLLGEAIARAVNAAPTGRTVRLLEVGGGSGGTTTWIASRLPPDRVEYCFTDVGPSLVERARASFAAHKFMTFRTFDLEGDPALQDLAPGSFDIIVAANVVHATQSLRQTLGKLRSLLAPGGMLCLLEVTGFERWIDITFGLTDGWWRFTDFDLRPNYPLLDRSKWVEVLTECGFEAAEVGTAIPSSREAFLVARRPLEAQSQRRFAIVGDGAGLCDAVATRLRALGGEAIVLDPARQALDGSVEAVIHLGCLELPATADVDEHVLLGNQQAVFSSLLATAKMLGSADGFTPRLWVVTRGACAAAPADIVEPAIATVVGFRRAAALEHREWRPTLVDLDLASAAHEQAEALLALVLADGLETEIAVRGEQSFASRLARVTTPPEDAHVQLQASASGVLADLRLVPFERRKPAAGQVEIRVAASGLNFRDVMNALAMRVDHEPLGGECSGVVTAVGDGVDGFSIGDSVLATVAGAFASSVLADARCVAHRPRGLTDAQAAALPLVSMTARYALEDLAGLGPGQSVLIHSAAGGVGLAAVQIAQRLGATIFATAGSEDKRAYLRSLGIAHVFSSRSLEFEQGIAAVTAGKGVDVVLNALSGPFITASVNALAEDGTFLEIGKQDIWSQEQFRVVRPRGSYHAIDLSVMRIEDPGRWGEIFHALMDDVANGRFRPLPVRTFPLAEAASAFHFMAQARHIGKIVLIHAASRERGLDDLDPDGIYLVTGGLAGLGLKTAQHLVQRGARALALIGRNRPGPEAEDLIGRWRAAGVEVLELQADVGNREEVAASFAMIDATGRMLRGVVHSAGALADGSLLHQEWDHFSIPFRAKVAGAWTLHRLTRDRPLDFFILYSSIAGTFGSAGQANHAAANAFLDALALYRSSIGLPALSIGWGAWSGIGAAAARGVDEAIVERGIGAIAPDKGMKLLESLAVQSPANVVVSPVNWPKYLATFASGAPTFLKEFEADAKSRGDGIKPGRREVSAAPILSELEAAAPSARRGLLLDFVSERVARVLGRQGEDRLDPRRPLNEMGLDSLLAVELRNRLGADLGLPRGLPATLVFDCPTIEALTAHLDHRLAPPAPEEQVPAASDLSGSLASIDSMTEDEIEAQFARISGTK